MRQTDDDALEPEGTEHGEEPGEHGEAIAVLSVACRFPGAGGPEEFWTNLAAGVEATTFFSREELLARGIPEAVVDDPSYVRAASRLPDIELFDADFFEVPPREAEILDPQARLFLEIAWEALERAGYAVEKEEGWVGVFAGTSASTYQMRHLFARSDVMETLGFFPVYLANDRDYFATRVSYKLNLRGPSVNVQTACSTSLTALHFACQSLLDFQCSMALAGGVRVWLPQDSGYRYQEGGIVSADGHTRAFDARGTGTLFGNGAGVVVLKRLEDALAEGDPIVAVIRGTGINNDGSGKVGFTAPSIAGQAEAVAMALAAAGVEAESITYVETHGSGTPLGDPIEVAALTEVFRESTDRRGFCALGSVKTNVGHLESAGGVAGLIKTILALENRQIPPSLNFEIPNPQIDFAASPFFVNTELRDWEPPPGTPRRAGVSSFGIGGTNVHVVVEEAPQRPPSGPSRPWQVLLLSARSETALDDATDRLAHHLDEDRDVPLPDVAYTLAVGRRCFEHRRAMVVPGGEEAREEVLRILRERPARFLREARSEARDRPVVFLLAGLGDHYLDMARGLARDEPVFREELDRCAEILRPHLGQDIRTLLYPRGIDAPEGEGGTEAWADEGGGKPDLRAILGRRGDEAETADATLHRTGFLQPTLFAVEWALARMWMAWGIHPEALLGYSLGEYTAAALAGIFSLEETLWLVAERARLIDALPPGAMLAVPLGEEEVRSRLAADLAGEGAGVELDVAVRNGPHVTVVAGPAPAVETLAGSLAAEGVACRRLPTTHAFHSRMLRPAVDALTALAGKLSPRAPHIPLLSNVSGTWLRPEEATDPGYWARHMVGTVRFADGLAELFTEPERIFLEIGPGQALGSLVLQHPACPPGATVRPSLAPSYLRGPGSGGADQAFALDTLAQLWLTGARPDWNAFYAGEERRRVLLPTYPFERRRYWIDPPDARPASPKDDRTTAARQGDAAEGTPPATAPKRRLTLHARPNLRTPYRAPTTETEREVCTLWQRVLGVAEVGTADSFFDLGGNSLLAPQILLGIKGELAVDLPLPLLLAAPTPGDVARAIERIREEGLAALLDEQDEVDLAAEVTLDPSISPAGKLAAEQLAAPRTVLLTGASGFVGAFLLAELLDRTAARVHCLVRAASPEAGLERIRKNLARYRLGGEDRRWDEWAQRIHALPGDLAEPRLGLPEPDFNRLAEEIDAVFHAGAWVNFTYPYSALRGANVGGTREALRLACLGRVKPFHFISSIAVFASGSLTGAGEALEDSPLPATAGLFSGYAETKWVAEKIVRLAGERGLPVTIHRPGVVGGSSQTGAGNASDLVWNIFKGSIQLGAATTGMGRLDVAPVDYVARAILHLSRQESSLGKAFHYPNPSPLPWDEAFAAARQMGHPLAILPPGDFHRALLEAARRGEDNALIAFLPLLGLQGGEESSGSTPEAAPAPMDAEQGAPIVRRDDDRNTRSGLAGSGITCPPVSPELVRLYLAYFGEIGFIEPASAGAPGRSGA